jgi:hypothetical protein
MLAGVGAFEKSLRATVARTRTLAPAVRESSPWLAACGICRHRDAARLQRAEPRGARCVGLASVRCAP